jgi:hypothetical protein
MTGDHLRRPVGPDDLPSGPAEPECYGVWALKFTTGATAPE